MVGTFDMDMYVLVYGHQILFITGDMCGCVWSWFTLQCCDDSSHFCILLGHYLVPTKCLFENVKMQKRVRYNKQFL